MHCCYTVMLHMQLKYITVEMQLCFLIEKNLIKLVVSKAILIMLMWVLYKEYVPQKMQLM